MDTHTDRKRRLYASIGTNPPFNAHVPLPGFEVALPGAAPGAPGPCSLLPGV